ncbi:hypothetical protein EUTSA_v10028298mg [Eutrema salsugineum]|uniref:FBD domain-containing protein n=1 Tax=Eutrema salsugineum TaxID=72664 RepID=V4NL12_EUTSA|nr:hypothetical protein EUTSA_v10028298mg [Eutrema salsugineum]
MQWLPCFCRSDWRWCHEWSTKISKIITHNLGGFVGRLFGESEQPESKWRFLNESLKLHKAPILEILAIELGPYCLVDANKGKVWSHGAAEPTSLPESLYICDTLVYLRLSGKVSVDVSSPVCLPSLKHLYLALYPDDKFMRCLSSLRYLEICCVLWACGIIFSQLIECKIRPCVLDWFEPLLLLLQNSPNLKVLVIDQVYYQTEPFPLSWNQPSYVPLCLSTSLEIFEWNKFRGKPEEMEIVRYIFANSKCRKRAGISLNSIFWGRKDIMIELAHMPEITSTSSKLHFYTQLKVNH